MEGGRITLRDETEHGRPMEVSFFFIGSRNSWKFLMQTRWLELYSRTITRMCGRSVSNLGMVEPQEASGWGQGWLRFDAAMVRGIGPVCGWPLGWVWRNGDCQSNYSTKVVWETQGPTLAELVSVRSGKCSLALGEVKQWQNSQSGIPYWWVTPQ